MYLNWLTERILRLEDDVRLYSAQCVAQAQETKAVKESLAEATMELEVTKLLIPTITQLKHVGVSLRLSSWRNRSFTNSGQAV